MNQQKLKFEAVPYDQQIIKLITLIHVATWYFLIALSQNNILSLFQILMMQL